MPTAPFTALITPFDPSLKPDNTLPGPQPPTGGTAPPPVVDNTLPGDIPRPEHPIYYPLPPGVPVYPDNTLPGEQPVIDNTLPVPPGGNGGWLPVYIDNTLPGDLPRPDNTLPGPQPRPEHPIVLPPPGSVPEGPVDWRAAWTPATGWIVVGFPTGPVPTPSKKKK